MEEASIQTTMNIYGQAMSSLTGEVNGKVAESAQAGFGEHLTGSLPLVALSCVSLRILAT